MAERAFVTGGSGLIGGALIARLLEGGWEVVGLARSDAAARALGERGAAVVRGHVLDEDALAAGMRGCAIAYHVAGINTLCPVDPALMMRVNGQGPQTVVRAAARAGVGRLVNTSSAATLGARAGTVGREDSHHRGWFLSAYERSKFEGERAALAASEANGVELVSVNPSSVQGPGRASGTGKILLALLDGRLKVFIDTRISLVDLADCVEGHILAGACGRPGERYLLSGVTLTSNEALELIARVAGGERRPRIVPPPVATTVATAVEAVFRVARRKPPLCREMIRTMLHGHAYDGSRATRELGLRYTRPEETLRRTVAWAVSEGLVKPLAVRT